MRPAETKYWDEVAEKAIYADNIWKRQELVRRLLKLDLIDKNILEIGVGNGTAFGSISVALLKNFEYTGIDVSAKWVEAAQKRWGLDVVQADVTKLPNQTGTCDYVVALDTLEHVHPDDREAGNKEIDRVLKPGGMLVLNIPVEESQHNPEFDHAYGPQEWLDLLNATDAEELCYDQYTVDVNGKPYRYIWAMARKRKTGLDVLLLTPWKNSWIPLYQRVFAERGHRVTVDHEAGNRVGDRSADVVLHMWAYGTNPADYPNSVNLVFMRRFEYWDDWWRQNLDPRTIDGMIFCNSWIKEAVEEAWDDACPPTHLIYNAVDPDEWTFKERGPGKSIGMACHIHMKKNIPLAIQIMALLPDDYELHIAGGVQDPCLADYLIHMAHEMGVKLTLHGHVPHEQMNEWWEQHQYCLSTSISEGNPNNVIEAMAKGICPVVHGWPGAEDQFGLNVFETIDEALNIIDRDRLYSGEDFRINVEDMFNLDNYRQVVDIATELVEERRNDGNQG